MKTSPKKTLCTLYIVRHGETEWNVKKIIQGHKDAPLTKNGIEQAKTTGDKLNNIRFDEVFSSDLGRAHKTAKIIVRERNLVIKLTKLLRERRFGDYEGKNFEIFRTELKKYTDEYNKLPSDKKWDYRYPTIETYAEVAERMLRFLREIAIAYPGKTILVVTHGGIIGVLLIHLGIWDFAQQHTGRIGNGGYLKLESDGIDFFVKEAERIDISKPI